MPEIPEGATKPSDHKKKKSEVPERFSFEDDGTLYTFKPTDSVYTPGYLRANRRRDETDVLFTMLEDLADDVDKITGESKTLAAVDNMSFPKFRALQRAFFTYLDEYGDSVRGDED